MSSQRKDTSDDKKAPDLNEPAGKQPKPNFDKPLGSSRNDEADLRDVAQQATCNYPDL